MSYSISGRSAIARPRSTGPGAPSASPAGSIIGKSAIARPCPDGPGAPSGDKSGYSVAGSALWRSPCDEIDCTFDTFTRTVASGWGTGDSGHTWVAGDMGGVQLSVDGAAAKAVYPQRTIGLAPYRTFYTLSGPWQQASFTLTQRFNLTLHDRVLSSGYSLLNTVTGEELMVWVYPRFNQLTIQNEYALSTYVDVDFTFADGWHYLKWEVSPTQTRAKVWAEGSAEPDWMGTIPAASIDPDRLHAITQGSYHTSGGDAVYEIDSIAICI